MGKSEDVRILVAGHDLLQKAAHLRAVQGVLVLKLPKGAGANCVVGGMEGEAAQQIGIVCLIKGIPTL